MTVIVEIDDKIYTYRNVKHYDTQEDYDKELQTCRDQADLIIVAGKVVKDRDANRNVGKHYVEMIIPPESKARLDALMVTCETDDPADIIANALQLFEHMVGLHGKGSTFTMVVDGKEEPFTPFG